MRGQLKDDIHERQQHNFLLNLFMTILEHFLCEVHLTVAINYSIEDIDVALIESNDQIMKILIERSFQFSQYGCGDHLTEIVHPFTRQCCQGHISGQSILLLGRQLVCGGVGEVHQWGFVEFSGRANRLEVEYKTKY